LRRSIVVNLLVGLGTAISCTRRVPLVIDPLPPMRTAPIAISQGPLPSDHYGALFCGVLDHLHDARWGACGLYIQPSGTPADVAEPIPTTFRIMVVPGIFGQCVDRIAAPFDDAIKHLRDVHHVPVEYVSVSGLGSTTYNAKQIADYLDRQPADPRYIAFGYSKGASDLLEAVSAHAIARQRIAAVVTVAGTVLGSRLPEGVPRHLLGALTDAKLATCDVADGGGIDSLRRVQRVNAMARFVPPVGFRAYSIASVSDPQTTSAGLQQGWNSLQPYSLEQDSQVIHEDAIVPGGTYLGMARADHWAVALPFSDVPEHDPLKAFTEKFIDKNRYPRVALFEAALRFVLEDLIVRNPSARE
jgi:hypothetical protein